MELPHLTQTVLLDRHMASLVHAYLAAEQRAVLHRDPSRRQRMSSAEALSLVPMSKLLRKLAQLHQRDQLPLKPPAPKAKKPRAPKPHKLRVSYAEMTTIRLYYARMLASAGSLPGRREYLATALGRFHKPSLQLESHIELADPRQLAMF